MRDCNLEYSIKYKNALSAVVEVEFLIKEIKTQSIFLQLPAWRPGRYSIANFAKNIKSFEVSTTSFESMSYKKIKKDRWQVDTSNTESIIVKYTFYAHQMDAGGSWLDEEQLYLNFINCLVYVEGRLEEVCLVNLCLPKEYSIACGLKEIKKHTLKAKNYYDLVDSPMMASSNLSHFTYKGFDTTFHIWVIGENKIHWEKLVEKFKAFTLAQISMMKEFPCDNYHFLIQLLPYPFYHGVEHHNSTVITLGPTHEMLLPKMEEALLGISSHELFHTWNVIQIRPKEMMPYDYSQENYFYTGFVAEGFTTYYGDLFLIRSGVISLENYLEKLNKVLKRHFNNFGRHNLSLADSSFDLWLDGYDQGIPHRKVSIYVKGAIVALMLDLTLRVHSSGQISLDSLMGYLWDNFGKKNIGYTVKDIQAGLEHLSSSSFESFFNYYIWGNTPIEDHLKDLLSYVGCCLVPVEPTLFYEKYFGFKVIEKNGVNIISDIAPDSVSEDYLSIGDELIAVDGTKIVNNLDYLTHKKVIELTLFRNQKLRKVILKNLTQDSYFMSYAIKQKRDATLNEKDLFTNWLNFSY